MQNFTRHLAIVTLSIWLTGCQSPIDLSGEKESNANDAALSDDTSAITSSGLSTNNQTGLPLSDDGLIAPLEPILQLQAAPGALEFLWVDRHNDASTGITDINLYQYDYRTEVEVEVDAPIELTSTRYIHEITAHQVAWDSTSYRVEICTSENCLSSLRMPLKGLLVNAVDAITPTDSKLSSSFGDHVALNADGNVAVVSSPAQASALVFFQLANRWIQASTLTSNNFTNQAGAAMRVAVSASGDTILVASIASNSQPVGVVFDRLGENWIETHSVVPITTISAIQNWHPETLSVALSDDGDRLAIAAHKADQRSNTTLNTNNQVMIFDRRAASWVSSTSLTVPAQHTRLSAFTTTAALDKVFILSALTGSLYLHEYVTTAGSWAEASVQFIDTFSPSVDNVVVSSDTGDEIAIAGWEVESNNQFSAVAWRFEKSANSWIQSDSVKLPPATLTAASLRLAADAKLASIAIGWQAENSANLAFYAQNQQRWQHLFSVPDALSLSRNLPLAQSVAISANNSTALVGTSNTGNGGVVSAFR